jgi:protein CpxP
MRKSVLMGFGLMAMLAGTAAAQQARPDKARGARTDSANAGRFEKRGGGPDGFLLRGIALTDAQKGQLKGLRTAERDRMQVARATAKKQGGDVREARQRGDTAAARAAVQRNRQTMALARDQHVAAVRNILTAEQRIQFDKNVAELKQRQLDRADQAPRGKKVGRGR